MKTEIEATALTIARMEGHRDIKGLIEATAETYNRFLASGDISLFKKSLGVFFYHFIKHINGEGLADDKTEYKNLIEFHDIAEYNLDDYTLMLIGLSHSIGDLDSGMSPDPELNLYNNELTINKEKIMAYQIIDKAY